MDLPPRPTASATSTSTATGTLTASGTGTATSTSTAPRLAHLSLPSHDPMVRPWLAPMPRFSMADVGSSDAGVARDGLPVDGLLSAADAWTAVPGTDAATGSAAHDGAIGLGDALVGSASDTKLAVSDGGRSGSVGGSGYDAGAGGKSVASGCGCAVGGHDARTAGDLPLIVLGVLAFWRSWCPRRRGRRTGQG